MIKSDFDLPNLSDNFLQQKRDNAVFNFSSAVDIISPSLISWIRNFNLAKTAAGACGDVKDELWDIDGLGPGHFHIKMSVFACWKAQIFVINAVDKTANAGEGVFDKTSLGLQRVSGKGGERVALEEIVTIAADHLRSDADGLSFISARDDAQKSSGDGGG